ncbi:MAG: NAD(P)H-hydrate dehydratase [Gammaproteobacteria bacterium]|nr:NAD(P)H-hydrate dehydratase [Gammaproteobacteria bacterium]
MIQAGPTLPRELYLAEQAREIDRIAAAEHGIPALTLMERAGRAAYLLLRAAWPGARRLLVLCGAGNNGGDGLVLARLARGDGLSARVLRPFSAPPPADGILATVEQRWREAGGESAALPAAPLADADVVVDALLGTGLNREVGGELRVAVAAANDCAAPVLSLDIPSGLHADSGCPLGAAVRARATISFIALKRGLLTAAGGEYCGRLYFAGLGVPPAIGCGLASAARRLELADWEGLLRPRPRHAHKGAFGHVLVVGGERGFGGAPRLAAAAAGRVGAGLVSVATRNCHAQGSGYPPEVMAHGVEEAAALSPLLARATALAVGPGLGRARWGARLLARALEARRPLVLDADALNLLAEDPQRRDDWILTPHPGEAARLLGCGNAEVQADRFAAAAELRVRYGGTVVLKGAGTLVADARGMAVLDAGNPGMAVGGMGDLLTGVIAALWAQGLDAGEAARLGVCLHAAAGDAAAAAEGERGLQAADLLPWLRRLANPCR